MSVSRSCCLALQQAWTCIQNTNSLLLPTFREGCQSSRLAVNKRIKRIECIEIKSRMKQRASDDEKKGNEVVINVKEWTGGQSFTSGVSPKK